MNLQNLFIVCTVLFFLSKCKSQDMSMSPCVTKETCGSCIKEFGCVWCMKPYFSPLNGTSPIRCFHETDTRKVHLCADENIINPQTRANILQSDPLKTFPPVQITPQRVQLFLRKGEEYRLNFTYAQAEDYPVDLYYLMDLSASMEKHRDKLSKLGVKLAETMKNLTRNFRLGFGSFVDKVDMPFVSTVPAKLISPCAWSCASPYSFKNHLSLTENHNDFSEQVKNARVSGNLDSPEGGLDALMQAMVCQSEIGWRMKARHLLVFSTDAGYHIAGDGKLAGIVEPHDGLCHMKDNKYTHDLLLDYPSIGHINAKAIEHNVNVIFAVVQSQEDTYKDLKDRIKEASIGALSRDSSNVVDLVKGVYDKLVDSITISDNFDSNIEVKYYSSCVGEEYKETKECGNLRVGTQVNFSAVIKILDCPKSDNLTRTFQIKPGALNESLTVEVNMLCDCPCEHPGHVDFIPKSPDCNGTGDLQCGVCKCDAGKYGSNCECDGHNSTNFEDTANCLLPNTKEICSNLGSCKCNKCYCQKRSNPSEIIYGKYCECNNYSCKRYKGQLCSGEDRGKCDCGSCVCLAGWSGDACECPDNNNQCLAPNSQNSICSDHGKCVCGKCECDIQNGYSGQYCEECPSCGGRRCDEFRNCVECQAYQTGIYDKSDCETICTLFTTEVIDEEIVESENSSVKICRLPVDGCNFIFKYFYNDAKELKIFAQKNKQCSGEIDIFAVVLGVIGSILLAGLIMLIFWKVFTTIHDRREYAKFENERKNASWNRGENPLFKNPTSTFQNPTYVG